jgi:hypothetical protein
MTDSMRWKVTMADGEESEFEKKWDEETEEAENDIMGLTVSFNLCQAIRFWNSNFLPNTEGEEPMDIMGFHSNTELYRLWAIAIMFALFVGIMNFISASEDGHEEEHVEHGHENFMQALKERSWEVLMLAWSMGFAWCAFFSAKMSLARIGYLQDNMVLAMCLTLVVSLVSFSLIRLLDVIADMDCTGARTDLSIIQVIRAIGLVVGFAWEQCFDQAVVSLSSAVAWPHLCKFVLAMFCVWIIVPAWYKYILPMAVTENWKWGFLVQDLEDPREQLRWEEVIDHIQSKRMEKKKQEAVNLQDGSTPREGNNRRSVLAGQLEDIRGNGNNTYQGAPYVKMGDAMSPRTPRSTAEVEELRYQNTKFREEILKLRETIDKHISASKSIAQA